MERGYDFSIIVGPPHLVPSVASLFLSVPGPLFTPSPCREQVKSIRWVGVGAIRGGGLVRGGWIRRWPFSILPAWSWPKPSSPPRDQRQPAGARLGSPGLTAMVSRPSSEPERVVASSTSPSSTRRSSVVRTGLRPWGLAPRRWAPCSLGCRCSRRLCCASGLALCDGDEAKVSQSSLPLGRLAHGDAFPLEVFAQAVVELGQSAELEVGHALLGLLDLRRVADIARRVGGHVDGGEGGFVVGARRCSGLLRASGSRRRLGR